jgi:hypothetical protein
MIAVASSVTVDFSGYASFQDEVGLARFLAAFHRSQIFVGVTQRQIDSLHGRVTLPA